MATFGQSAQTEQGGGGAQSQKINGEGTGPESVSDRPAEAHIFENKSDGTSLFSSSHKGIRAPRERCRLRQTQIFKKWQQVNYGDNC